MKTADFGYHIIRRRTIAIEVRRNGEVIVRAPQGMAKARIDKMA